MVCLNKRYKKTDVAIKNGQPREISNIVHTRHDTKANQKKNHNTKCVRHHFT